jgi:hypothetical protein
VTVDPKVVNFPLNRNRRNAPKDGDAMLAAEIGKAWRKLWRTVRAAQAAGLTVDISAHEPPKVSRHF